MSKHEITDDQIKALAEEALAAGDYTQHDICHRALTRDDEIDNTPSGDGIAYGDWTQEEARAECARVIAEGRGLL